MRIGFLCGSFDPIHIGHIHMATACLNANVVDKVIFVPTMQNPWKKHKPLDIDQRIHMIRMAIAPFGDKCDVSDIEKIIDFPNYSYKTCLKLLDEYPDDQLFVIAGTDVARQIPKWKKYDEIIKDRFPIIEISRTDSEDETNSDIKISAVAMDISSTMIRDYIKKGKILYPYLPLNVETYIRENNLYQDMQVE